MLRVVVADANVLLSAAVGEVIQYIPPFAKRYGRTVEEVKREFDELPLHILDRRSYQDQMTKAKELMEYIDPDDVDLVALALKLDAPIWSNDNHFRDLPLKRYTTAQLLKTLGI